MSDSDIKVRQSRLRAFAGPLAALLLWPLPSPGFEVELGSTRLTAHQRLTLGVALRTQRPDAALIGKSNLEPGLCLMRTAGGDADGPAPMRGANRFSAGNIPSTCSTSDAAAGQAYVERRGSYSLNGDDGNLNFDRGEISNASARLRSEVALSLFDFDLLARGLYLFDGRHLSLEQNRPDTTLSRRGLGFSADGKQAIGSSLRLLEYNVSRSFEINGHAVSFKLGRQTLSWGESVFLLPQSLNSLNPPSAPLLHVPGAELRESLLPVGMLTMKADVAEGWSVEGFYQYEQRTIEIDPVGSFFSTSDFLGAGGRYLMLGAAKTPEDPLGLYRAIDTCSAPGQCVDPAGLIGSTSSRTIHRDFDEERRRRARGGGQYGAAVKTFLPELNGGTELGFYVANTHARFPVVSSFAAQATCVGTIADLSPNGACQVVPLSGTAATREPLPVDTIRPFVEYPENIHLLGLSFNTNLVGLAVTGELSYRPNLPLQVDFTDLFNAAAQPAFPVDDVEAVGYTIPGRRAAAPDFLMTNYRRQPVMPGAYVQGYERMRQAQFDLVLVKTIGEGNWLGASSLTALLELGHTHVFGLPDLATLQFAGGVANSGITAGADGSAGINPLDVRSNPQDVGSNRSSLTTRQNPTAETDLRSFGTADSSGYRLAGTARYAAAVFGLDLSLTGLFAHDVNGVGPGIGQNFVEGRKSFTAALGLDAANGYSAQLRYQGFAGRQNNLRDRDHLAFIVSYRF